MTLKRTFLYTRKQLQEVLCSIGDGENVMFDIMKGEKDAEAGKVGEGMPIKGSHYAQKLM